MFASPAARYSKMASSSGGFRRGQREKGEKVVHLQLLAFRLFSKFILVSRQPEIGYNSLRED